MYINTQILDEYINLADKENQNHKILSNKTNFLNFKND